MKAIEYNVWMSMITMIGNRMRNIYQEYGITGVNGKTLSVLPSYPRNLTDFIKPSIIIQKVGTTQSGIGFGGFIGQYHDETLDTLSDVYGVEHEMTFQIDINADSNTQCALLTAAVSEGVINNINICERGEFQLYDYTADVTNPTDMGICKIMSDIDIVNLDDSKYNKYNNNNDYISAIRLDMSVIQTVIPVQEYVDLRKWVKISQTIKL